MEEKKGLIDLGKILSTIWGKKKKYFIAWVITFILACIWIFPQPRFYTSEVSLAPEAVSEDAGGLAGIASSFGINISAGGADAIYPMLYPDLMQSNDFVVSLFGIKITNEDSTINTDYYTYLAKHQKQNWLTYPFMKAFYSVKNSIAGKKAARPNTGNLKSIDPFRLSAYDYELTELIKTKVQCDVDKKTDVITITVKDQDPLVSALIADSVRQHLQDFIIKYRTKKARIDVDHYQHLADSAKIEYDASVSKYAEYCDANSNIILQVSVSERDQLENDMQLKYNTYTAMCTQLEAMKAKLQEKTPAFTILKSASVPIKPAGPKRVIFILGMLVLVTIIMTLYFCRNIFFTR